MSSSFVFCEVFHCCHPPFFLFLRSRVLLRPLDWTDRPVPSWNKQSFFFFHFFLSSFFLFPVTSICFFPLRCVFFCKFCLFFIVFFVFSFFCSFVFSFFQTISFFLVCFLSSVFLWFSFDFLSVLKFVFIFFQISMTFLSFSPSVCLHTALSQAQCSCSPAHLAGGEASSSPQASPPHSPPGPPLDPPPGSPSPPPPPHGLPPSVAPLSRGHFFSQVPLLPLKLGFLFFRFLLFFSFGFFFYLTLAK